MMDSQDQIHAFVEAHYYPDGLASYHVSLTGERPAWAPPSDDVGLFDEDNIALNQQDLVIEFKRKLFLGRRLTWCGVYSRSVDETVGDRRNHAGVGIWLSEYHITDFRYIIRCLRQLLQLVAGRFDKVRFEEGSVTFLTVVLPTSVHLAVEYPDGFNGIPYAQATSSAKFVTDCKNSDFEDLINDAADHLIYLSFGNDVGPYSRALVHVPAGTVLPTSNRNVQIIDRQDDKLSKIISVIPKASGQLASKVASLHAELKDARQQNADLQADLVQKIAYLNEKEYQIANLKQEINNSIQEDIPLQIMRQVNLLEQKMLIELKSISGYLSRAQTAQHNSSVANIVQPLPQNYLNKTKVNKHPSAGKQNGNRLKSLFRYWPLVALIFSVSAVAIAVFAWIKFF